MSHNFHHHFDTLDMKIDTVTAICKNNFRYEENHPKIGDLVSFREYSNYYQTFVVQEYSKIDDKTYSLKMKKMNSDNQSFV
jgi:hypothetical protein